MPTPIVKWAGGKTQLLPRIQSKLPEKIGTYFEPFLGGGALFFRLSPDKAIINDFNPQLINVYNHVKYDLDSVIGLLNNYQCEYNCAMNKGLYYYEKREIYNLNIRNCADNCETAALFIFLNKCGFNGLYRVNKNGMFNVPWNHSNKASLYDYDNIKQASNALKKATILTGDFETACFNAKENDFVFFDSPYFSTFDAYQKDGFSEEDHIRLSNLFKDLSNRNVKCVLTNSNTDFIKGLYKDFSIEIVDVRRAINRNPKNRVGEEIIVTNY